MRKLPNNYGTVYKLNGARRHPWIARKLVGKTPDHATRRMVPQYVTIGYYSTRSEALDALAMHNADPQEPGLRRKTVADVYEAWSSEAFPKLKETGHYTAAFKVLSGISDRPIADLKLDDLQFVFRMSGKNAPTLTNVKVVLKQMYKYAVIHEIVPQAKLDMIQYLDVGKDNPNKITRTIFSKEERARVLEGTEPIDRITAFLLCTGLRVSEYANLRKGDISDGVIHIRKAKTAAGVRSIPVPDRFADYVNNLDWMTTESIRYQMKTKYNHLPHDTRHTFATLAVEAKIDQRIIDVLIGHAPGENLTLSVYTHIPPEAMREAINKIAEIC